MSKSVRGIKKVLKNSKGFCTIVGKNGICACISEWNTIKYHKHGVSVSDSVYVPYKLIKGIGLWPQTNRKLMNHIYRT